MEDNIPKYVQEFAETSGTAPDASYVPQFTEDMEVQVAQGLEQKQYSSAPEQAKAFVEGVTQGIAGPLATMAETALFDNEREQRLRREHAGTAHGIGQIGGLLAPMGLGAAAKALGAGEAVAKGVSNFGVGAALSKLGAATEAGIGATTALGRIGSTATRFAVEGMAFQALDEVSKEVIHDPRTAESALVNIGLAGVLSGGLGIGVGGGAELWRASGASNKLSGFLDMLKKRNATSLEGTAESLGAKVEGLPVAQEWEVKLPDEIRGAMSEDPKLQNKAAELRESSTGAGDKYRAIEDAFKKDANEKLTTILGKTPEEAIAASEYDIGKEAQQQLVKSMKERVAPVLEKYDNFETIFKNAEIPLSAREEATNAISQLITDEGLLKAASEGPLKLSQRVLEKLPAQATANDLKLFMTDLRNSNPFGSENYQIAKKLNNIIDNLQQATLQQHVQINAPQMLADYTGTKAAYRTLKNEIEFINDRLRSGKAYGPQSFLENIKDMAPEDVVKRLNPKGDVEMQRFMEQNMPDLLQTIRSNEMNKLLRGAKGTGDEVSIKKLMNKIKDMSPEYRDFLLSKEQQTGVAYINALLEKLPKRMNPSGTARAIDAMWNRVPGSAVGMAAGIIGNHPVMGAILGEGARYVGREIPDAIKLATLRYLGSAEATSAAGFKAAAKTMDAALKGEKAVIGAVKDIAEGKSATIKEPSASDIDKLKKIVEKVETDPEHIINATQDVGYYLPEHGAAISSIAARSIEYLSTLKPNTTPVSPLSGPRKISKADEAKYNNALAIAQNPAIVLNRIADGSVTKEDLSHMKNLAPGLYERTQQKLFQAVVDSHAKGKILPYKTQIGISKFLEMPMNATMTPAAIQANQIIKAQMQPASMGPAPSGPKNLNKLDKQPGLYQTPQQQRQMFRGSHK